MGSIENLTSKLYLKFSVFSRFFGFCQIMENPENLENLTIIFLSHNMSYPRRICRVSPASSPYTLRSPLNSRRSRSNGAPENFNFFGRAEVQVASMLTESTVNAILLPNASVKTINDSVCCLRSAWVIRFHALRGF